MPDAEILSEIARLIEIPIPSEPFAELYRSSYHNNLFIQGSRLKGPGKVGRQQTPVSHHPAATRYSSALMGTRTAKRSAHASGPYAYTAIHAT